MLRAKQRWPEAYPVIVRRIQAIAGEFDVSIRDVVLQLAFARADARTLSREWSRQNRLYRRIWPRYGALYDAALRLTLDIEAMDGVSPHWRNWTPPADE